jgi:hypothetical protein
MPTEAYALCQIVPHVTEKGYRQLLKPALTGLYNRLKQKVPLRHWQNSCRFAS